MNVLATSLASSLALIALATGASAGDVALAFGRQSAHGSFGISISNHGVGVTLGAPVAACPPVAVQAPRPVWVPGRYEIVHEQVWIEGRREKVWVGPSQRTVCDAWGRTRTVWEPGRWEIVETPGHFETRALQVWRPGCYATNAVVARGYGGYGGYGRTGRHGD